MIGLFIMTLTILLALGVAGTAEQQVPQAKKLTRKKLLAIGGAAIAIAGGAIVMTGGPTPVFSTAHMYVSDTGGLTMGGNVSGDGCKNGCATNVTFTNPTNKTFVLSAQEVDWDFFDASGNTYAVPHKILVNGQTKNFTFLPGENTITFQLGPTNASDFLWNVNAEGIKANGKLITFQKAQPEDNISIAEAQ